jgi:phage-related protein
MKTPVAIKTARLIFAVAPGRVVLRMVLLHAFIKKTQQTPAHDIELARKRMQETS